jgi:type IX secretion system PorP/SprF family membrane protein
MFWNNYANLNPAMSGFQYSQHATATYTNYYPSLSGNYSGIYADYGVRVAENHGLGITYTGDFFGTSANKFLLNYNYQFNFKNESRLSLGAGAGVERMKMTEDHYLYNDSVAQLYDPSSFFRLNLGVAYNWRNLNIGISVASLNDMIVQKKYIASFPFPNSSGAVYAHAEYLINLSEKFQLTPRVLYSSQNGFQRLQSNVTLSYNQQFSLGASVDLRNTFGINVGWDILNKFRVAYNYNMTISQLSNGNGGGVHEFALGYLLK